MTATGIPQGYEAVDPRTARRVPLWHELTGATPLFPGDPPFTYEVFTTVAAAGYLVERVTSLGTHTGTHVSAPAHFVEGGPTLATLDEGWTLMPLVVLDVRARVDAGEGAFTVGPAELGRFERDHGRVPAGGCVLLLTGFALRYLPAPVPDHPADGAPGAPRGDGARDDDYHAPAPGFSPEAVAWLFDARGVRAIGSDTFGPDASSDPAYSATAETLRRGGITIENVGPGLARMRPFGDWVAVNAARPPFSGFPAGITGFTVP